MWVECNLIAATIEEPWRHRKLVLRGPVRCSPSKRPRGIAARQGIGLCERAFYLARAHHLSRSLANRKRLVGDTTASAVSPLTSEPALMDQNQHPPKRARAGMRTSSGTNVGDGKDSEQRQRVAIERHAKAAGFVIVDWFYDAAVSGADPVEVRPGFAAMLVRITGDGVRTIIVETANRFARDLMVQEVGFAMLPTSGSR
jgi:hypothetical protein